LLQTTLQEATRDGPGRERQLMMMFGNGGHWVFWQVALMWTGLLVFVGLLIGGIYALTSGRTSTTGNASPDDEARRILDSRLATGEIDDEDYRRLRGLIAQHSSGEPCTRER
jgi:uncharacterized membrane protein